MGSIYRYSAWAFFGFKDYTKRGYENNSKKFNNEALNVDLTGKIAIVTGANSGLGKYVASELFRRGATVHMLCRDETRGEQARQDILSQVKTSENKEVGENLLKLHKVDISDLKRVKEFVKQFDQEEGYCHILINNAGVMNNERKLTNYGVETNFAINTLGTHFLTKQMIPILQKSGPGSRAVCKILIYTIYIFYIHIFFLLKKKKTLFFLGGYIIGWYVP
jgi:dehydrogenase/reductase SDR family protein 12